MAEDRRTAYTKKVIKDALYQLLGENTLTQITVKEICRVAGINRATFYRHYEDIYDLFESLEREMMDEYRVDALDPKSMEQLLQVIYENQVFYKEFFRHHVESDYIRQIINHTHNCIAQKLKDSDAYDDRNYDVTFAYAFYGVAGLLWQWVESGCRIPPAELAPIVNEILRRQFFHKRI